MADDILEGGDGLTTVAEIRQGETFPVAEFVQERIAGIVFGGAFGQFDDSLVASTVIKVVEFLVVRLDPLLTGYEFFVVFIFERGNLNPIYLIINIVVGI